MVGNSVIRFIKDEITAEECVTEIVLNEIKEKEKVIDRLFPQDMRNFLKVMCQWGHMDNIMDIFDAYDEEVLKSKNILKAELYCVCQPEKAQTDKIKETLKKKYGVSDVLLEVNTDEALMGGYRLEVNGVEYDKSVQGMIKALQNRISGR
jgi:F-type H+-transporting ATPase subunit delta